MTNFSPRRKSEKSTAKKQNPPKKDPAAESVHKHAILQLQRAIGNKATIQMLMQQKNDTAGTKPGSMGLGMVEEFPHPTHATVLNGWSTVYQQVYAYSRIISGYKNYVDKILAGNALILFHQYKAGFTTGIHTLLKNAVIPNIDALIMILRTVASGEPEEMEQPDDAANVHDDGSNQKSEDFQRLKILEELRREMEKRMNGSDLDEIHKKVPEIDPAALKSPSMQAFQKELMSGAIFAAGHLAYFEMFLKKNDIDANIFKLVVKSEDDKKHNEKDAVADVQDRLKKWQDEKKRVQTRT